MDTIRGGRIGLVQWVLLALIAGLVALILFPLTLSDGKASPLRACLSHLKQLAVSTLIYREESDDVLPPVAWSKALAPYAKDDGLLSCPSIKRPAPQFGYAYHNILVGQSATQLNEEKTVLYFETDALGRDVVANPAGRNRDRHGEEGSNIAYLDSHAKAVRPDQEP